MDTNSFLASPPSVQTAWHVTDLVYSVFSLAVRLHVRFQLLSVLGIFAV